MWPALAWGQAPAPAAELESRLASARGLERARVLAQLVDAYRLDRPKAALEHGREALALFARHPDPSAEAATLNEMGWAHMTLSQHDSATAYLERGRELSREHRNRAGEARALSNLGTLSQRVGDPNRAVALFAQALALQREVEDHLGAANSLNNLGYVYSTDLADYGRSLGYHRQALSIRERMSDSAAVALSLNNIGIVYHRLQQYDLALRYFGRALDLRRSLGQQTRIAATLHNIGDVYLESGDPQSALDYHRQALEVREGLNDPAAITLSRSTIGRILLEAGDGDAARDELALALELAEELGDRTLGTRIHVGLAAVERAAGRPPAAEAHARRALAIAEEMGSRELVRRALDELGAAQEARGDMAGALATVKRSHALADSIFTTETARRLAELERLVAQEQQAREMEHLRREEADARLKASQRASQRNGIAGIAVVLGIGGLLLFRRRAERTRFAEAASVTDPLTGAKNRRYLEQVLPIDVAATVRGYRRAGMRGERPTEADLVFLVMDIDGFKSVNDEIGHAAGDRLLQDISDAIHGVVRDSEVVVRLGGDEFLVILRFCDRAQAALVAERLRRTIEGLEMDLPGARAARATCSIGFAAFPFDTADPTAFGWQDVVAIADLATYEAKRHGRNRWVGYVRGDGPTLPAPASWTARQIDEMVRDGRLIRQTSDGTAPVMAMA